MKEENLIQEEAKRRKTVDAILSLARLHHKTCENVIGSLGVHRSQHMMLMFLDRCNGAISQKELAEKFGISPAAVAVRIKKLENSGYISRTSAKDDGRINNILITEKGRKIIKESLLTFTGVDNIMMTDITEDERIALIRTLEKMSNNLTGIEAKKLDPRKYGVIPEEERT